MLSLPDVDDDDSQEDLIMDSSIVNFEDRIKKYYQDKGLYKPGDKFQIDYSNIKYHLRELEVGKRNPIPSGDIKIDQVVINNNGSSAQRHALERVNTVGHTMSASVTAGFKIGKEVKAEVKVPKVIDAGATAKYEFSLSATAGVSKTVEDVVKSTFSVVVAPFSRMLATLQFESMEVNPKFTADVVMDVEPYYNGEKLVYVAISSGSGRGNRYSSTLSEALGVAGGPNGRFREGKDANQVIYKAEGQFHGVTGKNVRIDYKECPLQGPCETPKTGSFLATTES